MAIESEAPELPPQVDYIVVGGGLSGLVVASRLSEDPGKTVLIIEAGSNRKGDPRIDTPGLMTTLYDDPDYDWKHLTVPQEHANNRQIAWPRGKVLGGSSAMNFSALVYPSKSDFDNWKKLGNQGWGSEDMAPYLKKFHRYQAADPELAKRMMMDDWVDEKAQGYDGPLPAAFTNELGPFNEAWMHTFKNLGYHLPGDPISGQKQGVFQNPLSIYLDKGTRAYAASAYYDEHVSKRPNLYLLADSMVEKIVLAKLEDGSGQVTATGVQSINNAGGKQVIQASKEVIIACGSVKSPQLLELSGIGGKALLASYGIEVFIDNPQVGENLQDHVLASISFEVADDQVSGDIMRDPSVVQAVSKLYQETRKGPLSGTPLSFAYTPLVDGNGALPRRSVESLLHRCLDGVPYSVPVPSLGKQHELLRAQILDPRESTIEFMYIPLQLNEKAEGATDMTTLFSKTQDGNYISLVTVLMHPFSRGSVHIASASATAQPRVDPQYLAHPLDMELLSRAVLFVETIAATEPFASLLKKNGQRIPVQRGEEGASQTEGSKSEAETLEAAKTTVRERLFTAFHPSGTCVMLPWEMGGVVDDRLRVHGSTNIRVVDASIFPIEPLGHIQATVYAAAEMAADLIKADW